MTGYAIAHLGDAAPHPDIATYIERISSTFAPYGGRFLVHATPPEVMEGSWPGNVVVIGFPSIEQARHWWDSPAYQEIAPLRSRHIAGDIILVDGVPPDYDPTGFAQAMRRASSAGAPNHDETLSRSAGSVAPSLPSATRSPIRGTGTNAGRRSTRARVDT